MVAARVAAVSKEQIMAWEVSTTTTRWLTRLALVAQRLHGVVPSTPVVRWMSVRLTRWGPFRPPTDGAYDIWSQPLIAPVREVGHAEDVSLPRPGPPADPGRPEPPAHRTAQILDRPTLRCLIAADLLRLGGLEEVITLLASGLPRYGLRTTVLYGRDHPALPSGDRLDRLRSDGVEMVRATPQEGAECLASLAPDVVSVHTAARWVRDVAERQGIPLIETIHNPVPASSGKRQIPRSGITGFIAVSDLARQQYLTHTPGLSPDRIMTIPNGVDTRRIGCANRVRARAALGLRDEFLFTCLARYAVEKNLFGLVTAFATVATVCPEAHLLIAGPMTDPLYLLQLRRLRDRLPCAARIHLRGHCMEPQVLLAAADGFVLDSFWEGGPLVSMEALCAGVPVVISEVGAARQQLGPDGERGYVVPNPIGDPLAVNADAVRAVRYGRQVNHDALVAAMTAIVGDRQRWASAREGLRIDAVTRFDADVCVRRYADVLTRVARGEPMCCPSNGGR
jgi:glycosyltransferase involved in cell wall biosynthesis